MLNKREQQALAFARRYPNKWHTFTTDNDTLRAIAFLHIKKLVRINEFGQFGVFN